MNTTLFSAALATALLASSAAAAQQPVSPALTVQQLFDQSTNHMQKREWAKALETLSILEERVAKGKTDRSKAIVALRKAQAMARLGQYEAVESIVATWLPKMPASDQTLFEDIHRGHMIMGEVAERRFDYASATDWYRRSKSFAMDPSTTSETYYRLAAIGIFVDPAKALADVETGLAEISALKTPQPQMQALLRGIRGRVLLNLGRATEARTELDAAIKAFGGLRYGKVDALDVAVRSDAAIAALRLGDMSAARNYLALAGAAMQSDQGFSLGKDMNPPACGGADGPKPEDVAVIELSIRENGSVGLARPIFYSGQPGAAIEFARAVSEWSWSAEELRRVSPFFRVQTRLEMRCTKVFNKPGTYAMLLPDAAEWMNELGVAPLGKHPESAAEELEWLKTELKRRDAADASGRQSLPILLHLAENKVVPYDATEAYAARALTIAKAASPPPPVLALFEYVAAASDNSRYRSGLSGKFQRRIGALLTQDNINSDPKARGALSLALFDSLSPDSRRREGKPLMTAIAVDKVRAVNDPFRVGALIRLANLEHEEGKVEDARALFSKTGLSAQQCALVDATPRRTGGTLGSGDYPTDAINLGFSGWTVIEFDIAADGKTANQRPLISFPPFVFSDSTANRIKTFRYEQSYRPEGGLGCGGQQQRVSYRRNP